MKVTRAGMLRLLNLPNAAGHSMNEIRPQVTIEATEFFFFGYYVENLNHKEILFFVKVSRKL